MFFLGLHELSTNGLATALDTGVTVVSLSLFEKILLIEK
jgi:hypothetical protein